MLFASLTSSNTLRAKQDDGGSDTAQSSALRVPADIREEAIEKIDAAMAVAAGPLLRSAFSSAESAEARKMALAELKTLVSQTQSTAAGMASLKSRLSRRIALLDVALAAAEVSDLAPSQQISPVTQAAADTINWLSTIGNGQLWVDYLQLTELSAADVDVNLLKKVSSKLSIVDSANDVQIAFMQRPELQSLKATIDSAVAVQSYDNDEAAARAELARQLDHLVVSLLAYESQQLAVDAEQSRTAYRAIRSRFPQAADVLRPVLVSNYFNHNLHITVSESLLSRMVADYRSESGCIADCIMGAWVTGSQVTSVNVTADIVPSSNSAAFRINAAGNTQSNTVAQKDPATVRTVGNHFFHTVKPVYFSGRSVSGGPASIDVDVNSRTVSVNTKYDGIPIIGGIIRNIARKEVAKSKGQSEAITRDKLTEEALPKFDEEVNTQLAELNATLNKTLASLDKKGVGPESISARSSSNQIGVSSRTMGVARLGGSAQPPMPISATGLAVQLHETTLNNTIDALGFNGRSIAEDDVLAELESALSDLLQREVKLSRDKPADSASEESTEEPEPPTTFVFSKTDPIRAHFGENELELVLRTGVIQEGKEEIPEQVITVPISVSLQGDKLVLDPGNIGVTSKEETNRVKQITRANQIRLILGRQIVRRELDTSFDLQGSAERQLMLTISYIQLADGWLTVEMQ